MCGLFGSTLHGVDLRTVSYYLSARGPDSSSAHIDGTTTIYHSRLDIYTGTDSASQPHVTRKGNIITFNGEIYSFNGHKTQSLARSEVSLLGDLYDEYGTKAFHLIDGMFSIAIFDVTTRILHLSRDIFGQKPLYFIRANRGVQYSSSLKLLYALNPTIPYDDYAIANYITFGSFGKSSGPWLYINQILPGTCLSLDETGSILSSLQLNPIPISNQPSNLDELLEQSVELASQSSLSANLLLSGGIDSSLLAYYAKKTFPSLSTTTINFPSLTASNIDCASAKHIINEFSLSGTSYAITPDLIDTHLRNYVSSVDLPSNESFNTYLACHYASLSSKCILTAQGLDEFFFGYDHMVPTTNLRQYIRRSKSTLISTSKLPGVVSNYLTQRILSIHPSISHLNLRTNHLTHPSVLTTYPAYDRLSASSSFEISNYLIDKLMRDADSASMCHSVELRPVFLSAFFLSNFTRLFPSYSPRNSLKQPLSKLLGKYLPRRPPIPKIGFELPLNTLSTELSTEFNDLLRSELAVQLFPVTKLTKLPYIPLNRSSWHVYLLLKWYLHLGTRSS